MPLLAFALSSSHKQVRLSFVSSAVLKKYMISSLPCRIHDVSWLFSVEVDSAKLASLMALGFEEAAARAMLIQCGNDVEAAAANLFARQTAR